MDRVPNDIYEDWEVCVPCWDVLLPHFGSSGDTFPLFTHGASTPQCVRIHMPQDVKQNVERLHHTLSSSGTRRLHSDADSRFSSSRTLCHTEALIKGRHRTSLRHERNIWASREGKTTKSRVSPTKTMARRELPYGTCSSVDHPLHTIFWGEGRPEN